jgi:hypothetical protein
VLWILLAPVAASAQIRPGIEFGGSLVWIDDSREDADWQDFDSRMDFNAAATVQFNATEAWAFTTGVRYSRLGNDIHYDITSAFEGGDYKGTLSIQQEYLGVPLFLQWNPTGDRGPFGFGGAEVAWLAKATSDLGPNEIPDSYGTRTGKSSITDTLDRYNVVFVIGAGWEIPVAGNGLEIAVRYGFGLTDFSKEPDEEPLPDNFPQIETPERKTRELALTLGFRL